MRIKGIGTLLMLVIVALSAGCAKHPPQGVTDLDRMWKQTRDDCATVYAPDVVRGLEPDMDTLDALVADGKYR